MSRIRLAAVFMLSLLLSTPLFAFNDALLPQVPIGQPGTKMGDIISPTTRIQIAAWCDFSKQIVVFNGLYVCVYNGKNAS